MQRVISKNSLYDQNINHTIMSKSEYVLAKHLPTHNPLKVLDTEPPNLRLHPTELPVDRSLYYIQSKKQEDEEEETGPSRPKEMSQELELTINPMDYFNLERAMAQKTREYGDLKRKHASFMQNHGNLQQLYNNVLHQRDQLLNENQKQRDNIENLQQENSHLLELLGKSKGKYESASKVEAENVNSNEIDQLVQERNYYEEQYHQAVEELNRVSQKKSESEAELKQKINWLQNQIDVLYKDYKSNLTGYGSGHSYEKGELHVEGGRPGDSEKLKRASACEDENEELRRDNENLLAEIDFLKAKLAALSRAHQLEMDSMKALPEGVDFTKKVEEIANKFAIDKAQHDQRYRALQSRGFEAEVRCVMFMTEIERLHIVINDLIREADDLQSRYASQEEEYSQQVQDVNIQNEDAQCSATASEAELLKKKAVDYRERVDYLETYLNQLQDEHKNYRMKTSQSMVELERWKSKNEGLEKKYRADIARLKDEVSHYKSASKIQTQREGKPEHDVYGSLLEYQDQRIIQLERNLKDVRRQLHEARRGEFQNAAEAESWKNKYRLLETRAVVEGIPIPSEGLSTVQDPRLATISHEDIILAGKKSLTDQAPLLKAGFVEQEGLNFQLFQENQTLKKENFEKGLESEAWKEKYYEQQKKHEFEIKKLRDEFEFTLQLSLKESSEQAKDQTTYPSKSDGSLMRSEDTRNKDRGLIARPEESRFQQSWHRESDSQPAPMENREWRSRDRTLSSDAQREPGKISFKASISEMLTQSVPARLPEDSKFTDSERMAESQAQSFEPRTRDLPQRNEMMYDYSQQRREEDEMNFASQRQSPLDQTVSVTFRGHIQDVDQKQQAGLPDDQEVKPYSTPTSPYKQSYPESRKPFAEDFDQRRFIEEDSLAGGASEPEQLGTGPIDPRKQSRYSAAPKDKDENVPRTYLGTEVLAPVHRSEKKKETGDPRASETYSRAYDPTQRTPERSSTLSPTDNRMPNYSVSPWDERTTAIQGRSTALERSSSPLTRERNTSTPSPVADRTYERSALRNSADDLANKDLRAIMLMIEVERLGTALATIYQQNEQLENTVDSLLGEKVSLEQLTQTQQSHLRSISAQLNELQQKFERLEVENKTLASNERSLKWELEKYKIKYDSELKEPSPSRRSSEREQNDEKEKLKDQIAQHQLRQEELESKLLDLLGQIEKYQSLLNSREQEIVDLANENHNLTEELKVIQKKLDELENSKLIELTEQKLQLEDEKNKFTRAEIAKLTDEHKRETQKLEEEIADQKVRTSQMERKVKSATEQIDRQTSQIRQLEEEIEELKANLAMAEDQKIQTKTLSDKKLKESSEEIDKISDEKFQATKEAELLKLKIEQEKNSNQQKIKELEEEKSRISQSLDQLRASKEEVDLRLVMICIELDRQVTLIQQKDAQITALQERQLELEQQHEEDLVKLQSQHTEQLDSNLTKQMEEHENEKVKIKLEIEKLQANHLNEIAEANHQIEELRKKVIELESQLSEREIRIQELEKENNEARLQLDSQMSLNKELQRENTEMKLRIETLTLQVSQLETDRNNLEREREKDQETIRDLTAQVEELQRRVKDLLNEIERINNQNKEAQEAKDGEFDDLVDKFEALKRNLIEAKEIAARFEAERANYEAKIMNLESKVKELVIQNSSLSEETKSMKGLLEKHNVELGQTEKKLMEKITDVDVLRSRYEKCVEGLKVPPKRLNSRSKSPIITQGDI